MAKKGGIHFGWYIAGGTLLLGGAYLLFRNPCPPGIKNDGKPYPGCATNSMDALWPPFRARVEQLMEELRQLGYSPVANETYRSLQRQQYYKDRKWSTVLQSYHNVSRDGTPESMAIDMFDSRYWKYQDDPALEQGLADFFHELMRLAPKYGLTTGGNWGKRGRWAQYGLGWDPGHVEIARSSWGGKSIEKAHAGNRPAWT
jgi:hypothetical protein